MADWTAFYKAGRYRFLHNLIIFLAVLFCYISTLNYPFQLDEKVAIVPNTAIRDLSDIGAIWAHDSLRFLVYLSFAVNYHFGGLDVAGYHILNILIHLLNALLVYSLAKMLIYPGFRREGFAGEYFDPDSAVGKLYPLTVALLFAVHPIQTEAVTYVWQRCASLATMFYLMSMTLYLRSAMAEEKGNKAAFTLLFAGSVISSIAAMLSKPIAITLPLAIFLLEFFFISGDVATTNKKANRLLFFVPIFFIAPLFIILGWSGDMSQLVSRGDVTPTHLEYLLTEFNVIVTYIRLMFFPIHQNLDYSYPMANGIGDMWTSFAITMAIVALAVWLFKKNRLASFGILLFFLALAPESSIFPFEDVIFEHRLYLPSIGFFIAISALVLKGFEKLFHEKAARPAIVTLAIVAIILSFATRARNYVWKDNLTMWSDIVSKSPDKPRPYNNLAMSYLDRENIEEAEKALHKSIELKPDQILAHRNLGVIYIRKGMDDKALEEFRKIIKFKPRYANAYYEIGNILLRQGENARAALYFISAIQLNRSYAKSYVNLGVALHREGDAEGALQVYRTALEIAPTNPMLNYNVASILGELGRKSEAEKNAQISISQGYEPPKPPWELMIAGIDE